MGLEPSDLERAAMSIACSYARRYPKMMHWLTTGDPQGKELLEQMQDRRAIGLWLRRKAIRRWQDVLVELVDKADTFVNHNGQAGMLFETYREQRDGGKLDSLHPTARAVHRAVYSLAIADGAPVLASLRYLETTIRAQSEAPITLAPRTIQKHVENLVGRGLFLSYDPGYRGVHGQAGRIGLELTPLTSAPDVDLVSALWLSADQRIALIEYAEASKERKKAAREAIEKRKADMLRALIDPAEILRGIDLEAEWFQASTVTGTKFWLPSAPRDGLVWLPDGARVRYEHAMQVLHKGCCESTHLPPLLCPCSSAEMEMYSGW